MKVVPWRTQEERNGERTRRKRRDQKVGGGAFWTRKPELATTFVVACDSLQPFFFFFFCSNIYAWVLFFINGKRNLLLLILIVGHCKTTWWHMVLSCQLPPTEGCLGAHFIFPYLPYEMLSNIWGFPKPPLGCQFRRLDSPWDCLPWDLRTLELCYCCHQFTGQERQGMCNIAAPLTLFCLTQAAGWRLAQLLGWTSPTRSPWVLVGVKSLLEYWVRVLLLHPDLSMLF